ncbi:MAG: hypothetical protein KAS32_26380 [Candidatus Peribacteraceae bacterium]|nr:hypothetical protein [Candidatus Peribacteraceae bacterium]
MDPFKPRKHGKSGPEHKIQDKVITMLLRKGWYVVRVPGSKLLSGMPDLFATHSRYGQRLIEIKRPKMEGSKFTPAQLERFPKLAANGSGVWVLVADTKDEYDKLFKRQNWWTYLSEMK